MSNLRAHPYITTYTGGRFRYTPPFGPFSVRDVAHSLSLTARFRGHTEGLYTVAEHSLLVYRLAERTRAIRDVLVAALMHDAHEAYFGDVPSPMKWARPEVAELEQGIADALRAEMCPECDETDFELVKSLDLTALHAEALELFIEPPSWVDRERAALVPAELIPRCVGTGSESS